MILQMTEYEIDKHAAEAIQTIMRELRIQYPKQEFHRRVDFARQIARRVVEKLDNA